MFHKNYKISYRMDQQFLMNDVLYQGPQEYNLACVEKGV